MGNHNERAHARFNMSSAHRYLNCSGSIPLIETLPESLEPSQAAKKGTRQHEINEAAVRHFLNHKTTGNPITNWEDEVEDNDELGLPAELAIETAKLYSKYIWENVLEHAMTGKAWGIEEKVVLDEKLDIWGSCDFWTIYINDRGQRTLAVVDYKNGNYVVDIKNNPQLIGYGLSFRKELQAKGKDIDTLRTIIIQPHANCPAYREVSYTRKQLDSWEKKFYKSVLQVVQGKPKFKAGDWCDFCPAIAVCKEYAKNIKAKTDLSLLDTEKIELPKIETWSDEQLGRAALVADDVIEFAKAIKSLVIAKAQAGVKIPGVKVIESEGRRAWIKDEEAVAKVLMANGIKEPFKKKLITLTEAKKKVDENLLVECMTRTKGSLCVVPETDLRLPIGAAKDLLDKI